MKETVRLDSRGGYWLYLIFAFLAVYAIRIHYSLLTSNLLLVPIFASLTYFYKKQNLLMIFREDIETAVFHGNISYRF